MSNISLKYKINEKMIDMTSEERAERRYQRRKEKRQQKEKALLKQLGGFDDVFSYINLYNAFKLCKQGVRWKASIQSYESNLPINTYESWMQLKNEKWKTKGFTEFYLSERGKTRRIQSVHIAERCIQRTLCDHYLVPILERSLIYDNGASIKGKGTLFTINRLKNHLEKHYNLFGNNGYILLFDFSNYFGNISHEKLYEMVDPKIHDERIKKIYHQLIDAFDQGIGLGSQVSQISAVFFANHLDHIFKEQERIKGYARYMDDGYIISDNLKCIKRCEKIIYEECEKLGIIINSRKIKICKLSHGFTFLKKKFILTNHGAVIIRLIPKSFKAVKRRLKKMKEKQLSFEDAYNSYKSWRGSLKGNKCKRSIMNTDKYFNDLFIKPFIKGVIE